MRKIGFLLNSLALGGAERVVLTLLEKLKDAYSIEVITLIESNNIPSEIKTICLSDRTGNENNITKLLMLPIMAWRLKIISREYQFRVVQSHIFRANYVNILATLFGANHDTQLVTHGVISHYKKKGLLGKINLFLIRILYAKANLIIANSYGVKRDMQQLFDFNKRIIVIHNPFPVRSIREKSIEPLDDKEFSFNEGKRYILSAGRFIKSKRQRDIIKAFSIITKQHTECELILLGEGEEKESLLLLTKELDLRDKVHFLGYVSNPFKYFSRCCFSVSASESESFGNVLVESMICKCPVISSDCQSGPREILNPSQSKHPRYLAFGEIEYAKYGILTPVGDIATLARAMEELLMKPILRKQYAKNGYERGLDFDIDKIIFQYEKVLLGGLDN